MNNDLDNSLNTPIVELGYLGRADGSCKWSHCGSTVLASVWGPVTPQRSNQVISDRAYIDIKIMSDIGGKIYSNSNLKHRDNTFLIKQFIYASFKASILDFLHPRAQISIYIQIINDKGSILSCCINAVTLALIDAGIPIKSFIASSTFAIKDDSNMEVEDESKFLVNPTYEELISSPLIAFYSFNAEGKQVAKYIKNSDLAKITLDEKDILKLNELAKNEVEKLIKFQKKVIYNRSLEQAE